MRKYIIGAGILVFIMVFSAHLAVYVFSGLIMFAGLVAMVESIGPLKWVLTRTGSAFDVVLFGLSVVLLWKAGVTVAMGVSVCGLLFTVFYKPILRQRAIDKLKDK